MTKYPPVAFDSPPPVDLEDRSNADPARAVFHQTIQKILLAVERRRLTVDAAQLALLRAMSRYGDEVQ